MPRSIERRPSTIRVGALLVLAMLGALVVPAPAQATTSKAVTVSPGGSAWLVDGSAFANGSAVATFTMPGSGSRPFRLALQFRGTSGHDGYRTTLSTGTDGSAQVSISRINADKETTLSSTKVPTAFSAGTKVSLEGTLTGSSPVDLKARVWASASSAPGWQTTFSDAGSSRLTGVQSPAKVGLIVGGSASASTTTTLSLVGSPEPQATSTQVRQLTAADVGVPSGTALRQVYGDLTITQPGTVLSGVDLHGFLIVKAANVTVRNSLIRGGPGKAYHLGLITSVDQPNLVVEDSDLRRDTPSVMNDGILGNNYTLRRVHVTGGVDNVKVEGDNVRVESSLLDGLDHFDHDPSQNGGATHNDSIQILEGRNVVVTGSTALATDNFALLGGAEWGDITLTAKGNYLDGGHCNAKLQVRNGHSETATITGNVFGPHRTEQSCPFVAEKAVNLTQSGNVLAANGLPVTAIRS